MKKAFSLTVILIAVFLILCACAQQVTQMPESTPSASSSVNPSSKPATVPTIRPTTATVPTTKPAAPTVPTTVPTVSTVPTAPTAPIDGTPPIRISTDWMVPDREVIPFAERFEQDYPFPAAFIQYYGSSHCSWLGAATDGAANKYSVINTGDALYGLAIYENGRCIYEVICDRNLYRHKLLCADGRSAYMLNADASAILRVDLFTGISSTIATRPSRLAVWEVFPCGKDMLFIFALNKDTNQLQAYYQDLHSSATKMVYNDVLSQTAPKNLSFSTPTSTQGAIRWQMMNPAFYEKLQLELSNPDSPFRFDGENDYSNLWKDPVKYPVHLNNGRELCLNIQNYYNIPAWVIYSVDPLTGVLTKDYGIIDGCSFGAEDYFDHFNYEDTRETPLQVLAPSPLAIPTLKALTPQQAAEALADQHNLKSLPAVLFYHGTNIYPYLIQNNTYTSLSGIPCKEIVSSMHYIYCITQDNSVLQLSPEGDRNTIYISENTLSGICYYAGSIYFVDGNTVMRINTIDGTCTAILRSEGTLTVDDYGYKVGQINILVVQGLYAQQYFFNPDTLELEKTKFV